MDSMMSRAASRIALTLLLAGCGERQTAPAAPTEVGLDVTAALATSEVVEGEIGPGSLYRLIKPANWNGTLLVYATGSTTAGTPVSLPDPRFGLGDRLATALAPDGVAVALSTYSETGWNIKDAAQRTHQLTGVFTDRFGRPTKTIVVGSSMGGLVAMKLAEDFPTQYAGSLPICSVAGGTRRQAEYDAHVWALFEYYYPGVLPGNAAALPAGVNEFTQIYLPALAAMTANPAPVAKIVAMDQTPVPGTNATVPVSGGVPEKIFAVAYALRLNNFFLGSLVENGLPYFDNSATIYSSASLPASELQAVNAGVRRYTAARSTLNALDKNYTPTGKLERPMLMLSGSLDANVPAFNQVAYLAAATREGTTPFLVQRTVPSQFHCNYPIATTVQAVRDLLTWTQTGVKPAP
jgi:pimeloyl-ACP methyl ester carboxylesterase